MFKVLIFSLLLPLAIFSQEIDQEAVQEVPIGSSGIDLFPEEEISTPTETPNEPSSEVTPQPVEEPSAAVPDPTSEPTPEQTPEAPATESPSNPSP